MMNSIEHPDPLKMLTTSVLELRDILSFYNGSEILWHPLGFASCRLFDTHTASVKLHYWPRGQRVPKDPDWPIHNHSFVINSRVLYGEVTNAVFDLTQGGDKQVFEVKYDGRNSTLQGTGLMVSAKLRESSVISAGYNYSIPLNTFHISSVPIDTETITLVVKTDSSDTQPLVLGDSRKSATINYQRTRYSAEQFWNRVMFCLNTK